MNTQNQIAEQHRAQQVKYRYYLIALAVACIGYSVHSTVNYTLSQVSILLGVSVLSWGVSVYCGLTFLKYSMSILYANFSLFNIRDGKEPSIGNNPERIKIGIDAVQAAIEENQKTSGGYAKCQEYLLLIGAVSFLLWHTIELFNKG
ncbi:MAG TPA: hypothetical protein DCR04_05660 [Flavobacteriales bacterium]|nr:hypothetical protein [Flavobacteriales bacterium]